MSIITEALKKAEKQRSDTMTSKEYLNRVMGPQLDLSALTVSGKSVELPADISDKRLSRPLIISGILIVGAIVFLSVLNLFIFSSIDQTTAQSTYLTKPGGDYPEVETYTKAMYPDIEAIERRSSIFDKMGRVLLGVTKEDEFLSNFELNGIIYDADNSWAIINNKMVRTGDILSGAKILAISPSKVSLLFRSETFDLTVR